MEVEVHIPAAFWHFTSDASSVVAEGDTVSDVLSNLGMMFDGLRSELLDDRDEVQQFLRIQVNGEDIRFLEDLGTALHEGDVVSLGIIQK